jgi:hypothetical protein
MLPRFICPHCHSPIDPLAMDAASDAGAEYRICPACDRPIVLALPDTVVDPFPPAEGVREVEPARMLEDIAT